MPAAIVGKVLWKGALPPVDAFEVEVDVSACAPRGALPNNRVEIDPTSRGVRNAVVWLNPKPEQMGSEELTTKTGSQFEFRRCQIEPSLVLVSRGARVVFTNLDSVIHYVEVKASKAATRTFTLPAVGSSEFLRPTELGFYEIRCKRHPWESATIVVADHPYYTVTDSSGRFTLEGVAPGVYTLHVWHGGMGATPIREGGLVRGYRFSDPVQARKRVIVRSGEATEVSVELSE